MSPVVLRSSSPEQFEVVFNDLSLEATVTDRSDIAAAWVETLLKTLNTTAEHLIVGIRTNDINGCPNPSNPPFFGDINPFRIATPATTGSSSNAGDLETMEIITEPSAPSPSPPVPDRSSKATLQLCCGKKCLIFSLLYNDRGVPDELANFLFDRNKVTLVGSGVRRHGDWLGRPQSMLLYRDPWELAEARAWRGLQHFKTLDQLAGELLGREREIRLPPVPAWTGWPLTENQKSVACLEAYMLSEIGLKLTEISRESFPTCYFMCSL